MNTDALLCWKCAASLEALPLPFGRRAECLACHAELHVCRLCRHHDLAKAKQCREPMAEEVKDKTRANFCDWFQPRAGGPVAAGKPHSREAQAGLEALFGGAETAPETPDSARQSLDRLFGD